MLQHPRQTQETQTPKPNKTKLTKKWTGSILKKHMHGANVISVWF